MAAIMEPPIPERVERLRRMIVEDQLLELGRLGLHVSDGLLRPTLRYWLERRDNPLVDEWWERRPVGLLPAPRGRRR